MGVNATPILTNRLAVSSPATLFSHETGDHRLKVNKAAAGDTAVVVFQSGFGGRAEMGLAGDDDYHVKVSADGAIWQEAIVIERSTGRVFLPASPQVINPNVLINGDFSIDQRVLGGGALAADVYGYDRWKVGTGSAGLSVANDLATLDSGSITQIVGPGTAGIDSFASRPLPIILMTATGRDGGCWRRFAVDYALFVRTSVRWKPISGFVRTFQSCARGLPLPRT